MSRKCSVAGCQTGYYSDKLNRRSEGQELLSLFSAPKDAEEFSKWQALFPNIDKKWFSVCELHFKEDDIIQNYLTLLPDGTTHVLQRGKKTLMPGAVPSINLQTIKQEISDEFQSETVRPNPEESVLLLQAREESLTIARGMGGYGDTKAVRYRSSSRQDETGPLTVARGMSGYSVEISESNTSDVSVANKENTIASTFRDNNSDGNFLGHAENTSFSSSKEDFTFISLSQNLYQVKLPQDCWTINSTPKYVVCSKWDKHFKAERRVVVDSNLNVKVFLKHCEILNTSDFNLQLSSFEDLSNVVMKVKNYFICPGIDHPETAKECQVYRPKTGTRSTLCVACQNAQSMASSKASMGNIRAENSKKVWSQRIQMWRKRTYTAEKLNVKLTKKVRKLEREVQDLHEKLKRSKKRITIQNRLLTDVDI